MGRGVARALRGRPCPLARPDPRQSQTETESRREGRRAAGDRTLTPAGPRSRRPPLPWTIPVLIMEPIREWV